MSSATVTTPTPGRLGRIYRGLTKFDFVGRRKIWFSVSIAIIVLGIASLSIRGFNLGIDFKGGSSWEVLAPNTSISAVTSAVEHAGLSQPVVEKLGADTYQVSADINALSSTQQNDLTNKVINAMAKIANVNANQVSTSTVGHAERNPRSTEVRIDRPARASSFNRSKYTI